MNAGDVLLWIIIPYVAIAVFVVGHVWRYRTDQFDWTSRSTQLLDRRILGWASPMFHYGALAAVAGHFIGLAIPPSVTETIGINESAYRWIAAIAWRDRGRGDADWLYRPRLPPGHQRSASAVPPREVDYLTYLLLTVLVVLGCVDDVRTTPSSPTTHTTTGIRSACGGGRSSTCIRTWRQRAPPRSFTSCMRSSPGLFWAAFPFSRLVHAWSIPLQYLGRPYILYRRRYSTAR